MRIGFEIDNMICTGPHVSTDLEAVAKQVAIEEAKILLDELKAAGHSIVLYTQRDMSTALDTEAWLSKNKIPHDAVIFNRPVMMQFFFAPDARKFTNWEDTRSELIRYGVLQERKKRNENPSGTQGGGTGADTAGRGQDSKVVDKKSGGAGGPEQEKGPAGLQVLK